MDAICGFFNLDGAIAEARQLDAMRAALAPNPSSRIVAPTHCVTRSVALATSSWGPRQRGASECLYSERDSGCIVIADARLDERDILAARLGLSFSNPHATQAALILHAYLRWGEQCAEHLYGDFAFAIWDPRIHQLYCARDIVGVRPLYIHHSPGRIFAFASRAQSLLALPGVPPSLNGARIADFLVDPLEAIDQTCTFYSAVERLPPAHYQSVRSDRLRRQRFWSLQPALASASKSDAQWADDFTNVLERAVRNHLAGDAIVGCMVSGGLDSSSLAVIAKDQLAEEGREALSTFSSVDNDPVCQETLAIRAVLELPGFAPTLVDPVQFQTMRADMVAAAWHCDEPFDGSMALIHAQYHAASRIGVGAVIDGIDGDVLLTESGGLVRQLRAGQWRDAWRNARGNQRIYPGMPAWRSMAEAARSLLAPDWLRASTRERRLRVSTRRNIDSTLISSDFADRIDLQSRLQRSSGSHLGIPGDVATHAARLLLEGHSICGMERYHRVAAWHGVDPRHPFMDRKVMEFCIALPDDQRMAHGWSKIVLRRAFQSRLPSSVCWRLGKQHLGWKLNERVLLEDMEEVRQRLDAYRDELSPYVDLKKLDLAARHWQLPAHHDARGALFNAVTLGNWLARHRTSHY